MSKANLFHEALVRTISDQAAFVDKACASEPQPRAACEELLEVHDVAGSFQDLPKIARVLDGGTTPSGSLTTSWNWSNGLQCFASGGVRCAGSCVAAPAAARFISK